MNIDISLPSLAVSECVVIKVSFTKYNNLLKNAFNNARIVNYLTQGYPQTREYEWIIRDS